MNKEGHIGLVKNTFEKVSDKPSTYQKDKLDKMKEDAE
jgi:hypothetical protein